MAPPRTSKKGRKQARPGRPKGSKGAKAAKGGKGHQAQPKRPARAKAPKPEQQRLPGTGSDADRAVTTSEATQALAAEAKRQADAGKNVSHHLAQALRQAWLADLDQYVWPNSTAAAGDIGVSAQTLRNWSVDGCPIPKHQPIPKAPVYRWLYEREQRSAEQQGGGNKELIQDAEARIKQAKAQAMESRLVDEAEERATQAIVATFGQLKHAIVRELPSQLAAEVQGLVPAVAEDHIRRRMGEHLNQLARQHGAIAPDAAGATEHSQPEQERIDDLLPIDNAAGYIDRNPQKET